MRNQPNIAEEIANLTPAQQDTILKVAKVSTVLSIVVWIPTLLWTVLVWCITIDPPAGFTHSSLADMNLGGSILVFAVISFLLQMGILLVIKLKFPFYSDEKYKYIKQLRKGQ